MRSWSFERLPNWVVAISLLCTSLVLAADEFGQDPSEFWHFFTRPDLRPPKWNVKVHNASGLAEGYWFTAPKLHQAPTIGSSNGWGGPTIYDSDGELVWSGVSQLDTPNTMDFRPVYIEGVQRLAMLDRDRRTGTIMNNDYEVYRILDLESHGTINGHEFNVLPGGKTALHIANRPHTEATRADKEMMGMVGESCKANYAGIKEVDVQTGKTVFEWTSLGRISPAESTVTDGTPREMCDTAGFLHFNAVDKLPDGDYILSARHCDTIYKISHVDGSIVWRLGGKQSDFQTDDVDFSRQHDAGVVSQNQTHTVIKFLDNALGEGHGALHDATHDFSRGLIVALRTDITPMVASLVAHYDHPKKNYAKSRGSMQILPNGNIFMGWSQRARQSEHSADGTVLMEANFYTDKIGSYRNYKFPFVGRPLTTPDVASMAYLQDEDRRDDPRTKVYVSWNGDTEVRTWQLYGSMDNPDELLPIESAKRDGFETSFQHSAYLKYVQLEGLDESGTILTKTGMIKTEVHPSPPGTDLSSVDHDYGYDNLPGVDLDDSHHPGDQRLGEVRIATFSWTAFAWGVGTTIATLIAVACLPLAQRTLLPSLTRRWKRARVPRNPRDEVIYAALNDYRDEGDDEEIPNGHSKG